MPVTFVPPDGRLTSQNVLTGPLDSTAVIYIVSPGNVTNGNSYQVSLATLATFFGSFGTPTILTTGSSYASVATDTRILLQLGIPTAFTITMLGAVNYGQPILIKDIAGNLDGINTLTVNFSGGETADGQSSIVLDTAYSGFWLNPLEAGNFYVTAA